MPDKVQYEREVGSGEQLPMGAAKQLNAQAAVTTKPPIEAPMPELAEEGQPYSPQGDEEELLFAEPTGEPRDFVSAPVGGRRIPAEVVRKLPALARAARSPGAPPSLIALYRLTVRQLEDEMKTLG